MWFEIRSDAIVARLWDAHRGWSGICNGAVEPSTVERYLGYFTKLLEGWWQEGGASGG